MSDKESKPSEEQLRKEFEEHMKDMFLVLVWKCRRILITIIQLLPMPVGRFIVICVSVLFNISLSTNKQME